MQFEEVDITIEKPEYRGWFNMTKRTNDVSTEEWLRFYFSSPVSDDNAHRLWMTNFIERIQQSSYSDGYTDGKCDEIDKKIGM